VIVKGCTKDYECEWFACNKPVINRRSVCLL
jgi:uncharacterized protein YodC (DUF2158 family)